MFVHDGGEGKGLWGEFPDLPGCMTDGGNPEELMKNAADALESWLAAVSASGDALPEASDAKALTAKADAAEDPVLFFVPVTGYLPGARRGGGVSGERRPGGEITCRDSSSGAALPNTSGV